MKNTLISIVSEQTIPNILFILENKTIVDQFVFLTTNEMEKRSKRQATIYASEIEVEKTLMILIDENKIQEIKNVLHQHGFSIKPNEHFMVNITGGTKIMALAVYEYFKNLNSSFYYLPIGKNQIRRIEPHFAEHEISVKSRLNLQQYLVAYGLTYTIKERFCFNREQTAQLFSEYRKTGFLFDRFPLDQAFEMMAYPEKEENIRGTWFEEYLYYEVMQQFGLPVESIASAVKIYYDGVSDYNDNEFDLMFVKENELFVIECKVHLSGSTQKAKLDAAMYKLGAISKNFGLKTNSYIFTLENLRIKSFKFKQNLRKCGLLNIKNIYEKQEFITGIDFNKTLKTK